MQNEQLIMSYNRFTNCIPVDFSNRKNINYIWNFKLQSDPIISHNIVEDVTYDNFYFSITLKKANTVLFENNTFQNLHLGGNYGGGISHWIIMDPAILFSISFVDCRFYNNEAIKNGGKGGAFHQGISVKTENCMITFDGCKFISNKAPKEGGAIATETKQNLIIQHCLFENNTAGTFGGAIYINPDYSNANDKQEKAIISDCRFLSNVATNGNAIYADKGESTSIEITNCTFNDDNITALNNKLGFCIASGFKNTEINNFTINIESSDKIEGALHIFVSSTVSIRKLEINEGRLNNAIKLNNTHNLATQWKLSITESTFLSKYDQSSCITVLLSDKQIQQIEGFSFVKNAFSGTILSLDVSDEFNLINDINITQSHSSKGSAIKIPQHNNNEITIENTNIKGSSLGNILSLDNEILNINNCQFIGNSIYQYNGSISIKATQSATIESCLFDQNTASQTSGPKLYGGAIYIESSDTTTQENTVTIHGCTFTNNDAHDGLAIYSANQYTQINIEQNTVFRSNTNQKYMIVLSSSNLVMSDVEFSCQLPIFFRKTEVVEGIVFRNVKSTSAPLLILDQTHYYNIDNVQFYSCKCTDYVIISDAPEFTLSNSIIEFDDPSFANSCGGVNINAYGKYNIISTIFNKTTREGIKMKLTSQQLQDDYLKISGCTFDGCNGKNNNRVFLLTVSCPIEFYNNAIKNTRSASYSGVINLIRNKELTIDSCQFINNECNGLYGGGVGLFIEADKVVFDKCKFVRNSAIKSNNDDDEKRPQPDGITETYYNGDGGGIQFGYSSSLLNVDLEFIKCKFANNFAFRHGGAMAIQTLKTVKIIGCTFEENSADNKQLFSSSKLLFENHFDKKQEGRGGAIYINPTFSYNQNGQLYPPNNEHMTSIDIRDCIFTSNKAFDGFSIYIEGDEPDSDFSVSIVNNTFKDNCQINGNDDINQSFRAIIASEVSLNKTEIETKNVFLPIETPKVQLVDHYGNLIQTLPTTVITIVPSSFDASTESLSFESSESSEIPTMPYYATSNFQLIETDSLTDSIFEKSPSYEIESNSKTETFSYEEENSSDSTHQEDSLSESMEVIKSSSTDEIKETFTSLNSKTENLESFSLSQSSNSHIANLDATSKKKRGMGIGAIIGIVCGIVFVLLISIIAFYFVYKRKNLEKGFHANNNIPNQNYSNVETKTSKSFSEKSQDQDDEDEDLDFWL